MHAGRWNESPLKCVVMCGGRSSRFARGSTHKSMAAVGGVPLLRYVVDYWRAYTEDFIFVVKNGKADVMEYVATLPITAEFVEPTELRGIADGLTYVEPLIDGPFIMVLGDCFCSGRFDLSAPFEFGIGVLDDVPLEVIRRNYAVTLDERRVTGLEEKPLEPPNALCGLGFYFFQPAVFDYVRMTAPSSRSGEIEITDVLQTMVDQGVDLRAVMLDGAYVNVNKAEDLEYIDALLTSGRATNPYRA